MKRKTKKAKKKAKKTQIENSQIERLQLTRVLNQLSPKISVNPFSFNFLDVNERKKHLQKYSQEHKKEFSKFSELPISSALQKGLNESSFVDMRKIQRKSLIPGLSGRDILGAAKTGSGKTLCFLIPVIENLYRYGWEKSDGIGAIILSPTKDLAIQIFSELCKIGKYHNFSGGLIIGGAGKANSFSSEQKVINCMNILVCTPGRLLHHFESSKISVEYLRILVLDEADKLLSMGFQKELKLIMNNLPKERQTLLFSATQTNSVKKLAMLSLNEKNTEYISAIEDFSIYRKDGDNYRTTAIPKKIKQFYCICELENKVNVLYHLLVKNAQQKIIVFASTIKQVNFLCRTLKALGLKSKIFQLVGNMKVLNRNKQINEFSERKSKSLLISTDLGSRGLDFLNVDLIIQLDIPMTIDDYIHRIGRTARNKKEGRSIMMIMPVEMKFVDFVREKSNNGIQKMEIDIKKISNMKRQIKNLVRGNEKLQFYSKKYIFSYLKHLGEFSFEKLDISTINVEGFFESVGVVVDEEEGKKEKKSKRKKGNRNERRESNRNERKSIKFEKKKKKKKKKFVGELEEVDFGKKEERNDLRFIDDVTMDDNDESGIVERKEKPMFMQEVSKEVKPTRIVFDRKKRKRKEKKKKEEKERKRKFDDLMMGNVPGEEGEMLVNEKKQVRKDGEEPPKKKMKFE